MDALLKALFSQNESYQNSFDNFHPEQLLAAQYGPQGGLGGTPYGMWGSMFGQYANQDYENPIKAFSPSSDPYLTALLSDQ